jgi:phosphatidate cytidylyltransferase
MTTTAAFRHDTWLLFAGLGAVLLSASLVAALLKWRIAHGEPHGVIDNLRARVNAWWAMVVVIGLAFAFGRGGAASSCCSSSSPSTRCASS